MADTIIAIDFGTNYFLWPLALVLYGVSVGIEIACRKHLKFKTLVGVPELARDGRGGVLLSEGIYGRARHPRYASVMLGITAFALFANYLASYILLPLSAVGLYFVTVLEERELRARFGEEYVKYSERAFLVRAGSHSLIRNASVVPVLENHTTTSAAGDADV
jgi:protein-S-isoprenylcysteine O-methyltransferase Ste14